MIHARKTYGIVLWFVVGVIAVPGIVAGESVPPDAWEREAVDWRASGGSRIRAVHYPPERPPVTLRSRPADLRPRLERRVVPPERPNVERARRKYTMDAEGGVQVMVINMPPLAGMVPWIAVVATDERLPALEFEGVPKTTVGGNLIQPAPLEANYAIGIFDTGGAAHLLGNQAAHTLGLFAANRLTTNTVTITGATGSVEAWVSQPIGIYVDGLAAIDPDTLLADTTGMFGEYNVAVAVGQTPPPGQPDLPTAIGMPLAVFYNVAIYHDQTVTVTRDDDTFIAPDVHFHTTTDPATPQYPNAIPLELRPSGAAMVAYFPSFEDPFPPQTPSIIIGNSAQSVYFVSRVDLYHGNRSDIDLDRFMFDTGAQVSVIGDRVAASLNLDPGSPDFMVEIQGVTGDTALFPGFNLDRIDIPALGNWLSFTSVPVVLINVASPEGGTLDGIIGMNLMLETNFVVRAGGLQPGPDPMLEYALINPPARIADFDNDGDVDMADFGHLQQCYTTPGAFLPPSCANADFTNDGEVTQDDLGVFMTCLSGANVPAHPECTE